MQKSTLSLGIFAAVLCTAGALSAAPQQTDTDQWQAPPVEDSLRRFNIQNLSHSMKSDGSGGFLTVVELGSELAVLDLAPYSLRSPDFELIVIGDDLVERAIPAPNPNTYRGTVEGVPGSHVSAALRNGKLSARISYGNHDVFFVQPWVNDLAADGDHVVYHGADVIAPDNGACGGPDDVADHDEPSRGHWDDDAAEHPHDHGGDDDGETHFLGVNELTEISCDADFQFYQDNNSSIPNTLHQIEKLMNIVEGIYMSDVGICFDIKRIIVRTSSGANPYTSNGAGTLLNQFRNHWNGSMSGKRTDHNHLFTGRNIDGGTIGIANCIGCICNLSQSYALSQAGFSSSDALNAGLVSHEIGHVYNASHCCGDCSSCPSCHIMCPCLGGCSGSVNQFGTSSTNSIVNHRNSRGCLEDGCGSDLDMIDLEPGLANQDTTLSARGANNGEQVSFYWGKTNGTSSVAGCGAVLGLGNAKFIGTDTASSQGIANLTVFVPNKAGGKTLRFQAVGLTNCLVSEVLVYSFP